MSEIFRLRTQSEIDEEAAAWVWRLDSESLSDLERKEFEAWLGCDPRHRRSLEEFSRVWGSLDDFAPPERDAITSGIVTVEAQLATEAQLLTKPRQLWLTVAASLALCVVGGAFWLNQRTESQALATAVGQRQEFTLADGSIVTLNTNTIVRTDLRNNARNIYLQKGEAHFQVAHDQSRPFLVHAGGAVVRAVGTQFEVRVRADHKVDVLVNEGRVEVGAAADMGDSGSKVSHGVTNAKTHAISAGERVSTDLTDIDVVTVTPQELSNAMAWRDGAIVFDGQSLAEAIAEVSRYTDSKIVMNDPQVAQLHVGGRFITDDLQGFFAALQAALPITVRNATDGTVYIEQRL